MADRFSGVRSGAMDDLLIRRVVNDALSKLKKSLPPGSEKPRTDKELHKFLEDVRRKLQRFNIPIPGTAIDMPSDPPKGIAWAAKVAMANKDTEPEFVEFAITHGQADVYLAALALSSPENDDHGEIRALQAALELLKESAFSIRQGNNAKNLKSPFRALVLSVLEKNPNDTVDSLWVKLQGLTPEDLEIKFNGKDVLFDDPDFFIIGETKKEQRMKSYVEWDIGTGKPTRFNRSSLDKMISGLRIEHGLFKSI